MLKFIKLSIDENLNLKNLEIPIFMNFKYFCN